MGCCFPKPRRQGYTKIDTKGDNVNVNTKKGDKRKKESKFSKKIASVKKKHFRENKKQKGHLIEEFLSSEEVYVNNLKDLIDYFIIPIQQYKILPQDRMDSIFGEIQALHFINKTFLNQLKNKKKALDARTFAKILILNNSSIFMGRYNTIGTLTRVEKDTNKAFKKFLGDATKKLRKDSKRIFFLDSFMILPIQRIPRYKLFMRGLIKNSTVLKISENIELRKANKIIDGVAKFCNEKQKDFQNNDTSFIKKVAKQYGIKKLVQPYRLFKRCSKEGQIITYHFKNKSVKNAVMFYLFTDMLLIVKQKRLLGQKTTKKIYKIHLYDKSVEVVDYSEIDKDLFGITFNSTTRGKQLRKKYVFRIGAEGKKKPEKMKKEWVEAINRERGGFFMKQTDSEFIHFVKKQVDQAFQAQILSGSDKDNIKFIENINKKSVKDKLNIFKGFKKKKDYYLDE